MKDPCEQLGRFLIFALIGVLVIGAVIGPGVTSTAQEKQPKTDLLKKFNLLMEIPFHGLQLEDNTYILKKVGHISIHGGIGTSDYFSVMKALVLFESQKIKHVVVHVNSGGGGSFDGLSIGLLLSEKVAKGWLIEIKAYGLVASAAVRILVSGSKGSRYISDYSLVMVHELSSFTYMSSESTADKRKQAEILKRIQDNGTYFMSKMTGISFEKLTEMREEETWMSAEEAVNMGFADKVIPVMKPGEEK